MEYYKNILCITVEELTDGILTIDLYKWYCKTKKIRRLRRACYGTPALIDIKSLPKRVYEAVIAKYGDLNKEADKYTIIGAYKVDQAARDFYKSYRLPSGSPLPEEYIEKYTINASVLNAANFLLNDRTSFVGSRGNTVKNKWQWISDKVNNVQEQFKHSLPANHRRFKTTLEEYLSGGYTRLISGKFENKNSEKVSETAKIWLLTRWADQVNRCTGITQLFKEYNEHARNGEWVPVKNEDTIYRFIYSKDIKHLWYAHRYGELVAKEKYSYQHKTMLPTMRDSLWYSDGTKLNYYYQFIDSEGKIQIGTLQVYEVMDAYSEVFLGYHISKREDFEAQFKAYKMAFKYAMYKPYQITFDNQGGHKKLENSNFFSRLAHLSIKTAPYNGKSKTIENAFGRFQQQILKQDWFFTGQNITATSQESRPNMEFILANKHNLPTESEVRQVYEKRRNEWNNSTHHSSGISRIEMYLKSTNEKAVQLQPWDLIDLFYITREQEVTCTAWGISFKENKVKHDYIVNGDNDLPDLDWLQKNIDKKFTIKWDPESPEIIYLYEKTASGLRYVAPAVQKVAIHRGKQEQTEGEMSFIKAVEIGNKLKRFERFEKMSSLQKEMGTSAADYGFNTPSIAGIQTSKAAKKNNKSDGITIGIGAIRKIESNITNVELESIEEFDAFEYAKKIM